MITFKEYLIEARKNPTQNPKISPLDQLKEIYKDYPNAFVTFTRIHKFGSNPQSKWNTPIGIYAYPIKYVVERLMRVPFAGDEPYIFVFDIEPGGNHLIIDENKKADYTNIKDAITSVLGEPTSPKQEYYTNISWVWQEMYNRIHQSITKDSSRHHLKINAKGPYNTLSRKILMKAGYQGVIDPGTGLINEDEPTQAVFFTLKGLKVIDMIRNKINRYIDPGYLKPITKEGQWSSRLMHAILTKGTDRDVEKLGLQYADKFKGYQDPDFGGINPLVKYAMNNNRRVPSFEPTILKDGNDINDYVENVIKGRWPEAERILNPLSSYYKTYVNYLKTLGI